MSREETPNPHLPEGSCQYFVARKRRYCRFKPKQGCLYCAEHAPLMGVDLDRKRVQCPYEPKHTCYEDKLKQHMKKCPSRPREKPAYFSESINSGDNGGEIVPDPKVTVLKVPEDELMDIIDKVNRLYHEYIGDIEEQILTHECLRSELENTSYGDAALRHRKQQASLIGHMDHLDLLRDGMCYLEMGAGKGQLSHWLHEAVEKYQDNVFILIDRSHVRNKMDNLHKEEQVMERIRIDIEHLRLGKVPTIQNHDKPVVAFGKHLCGPATDLSLRCVCETLNLEEVREEEDDKGNQRKRLKTDKRTLAGTVIALCCHHRCTWTPYVGKKFFKSCGLTARDFQILSSMSSWATCAWKGWSAKRKDNRGIIDSGNQQNMGTSEAGTQENMSTSAAGTQNDMGTTADENTDSESNANRGVSDFGTQENMGTGVTSIESCEESVSDEAFVNSKTESTGSGATGIEGNNLESNKDVGKEMEKGEKQEVRKEGQEVEKEDLEDEHGHVEQVISSSINKQFSQEEREVIGRKCKRLIDYGRIQYLRDHGLQGSMKIYIEEFYTPENIVLLASR